MPVNWPEMWGYDDKRMPAGWTTAVGVKAGVVQRRAQKRSGDNVRVLRRVNKDSLVPRGGFKRSSAKQRRSVCKARKATVWYPVNRYYDAAGLVKCRKRKASGGGGQAKRQVAKRQVDEVLLAAPKGIPQKVLQAAVKDAVEDIVKKPPPGKGRGRGGRGGRGRGGRGGAVAVQRGGAVAVQRRRSERQLNKLKGQRKGRADLGP